MSESLAAENNASEAELAKFNALADKWWDPTSEFKPLHDINPLRVEYINQHTPVKGLKILDIGTGGGILAESLTQLGAEVTAIDLAPAPLAVAKIHAEKSGYDIHYEKISAEELCKRQPESFDVVTCLETIEHVPDVGSMVHACASLCKKDGSVYFSTINRTPKAFLFAIVGAEYVLKLLPKGTHEYKMLVKPSELAGFVRKAGLNLEESIGLHYNPISKKYWLADGLDVNYMMRTIK